MENPKTILSQYKNLNLQCIWNKQGQCSSIFTYDINT